MKNLLMAILICSLAFAAGCSDDEEDTITGGGTDPSVILPLAAGNEWSGSYRIYDSTGAQTGSTTYIYHILEDTTVGTGGSALQYWKMQLTLGSYIYTADDLYRNRDTDGLWVWFNYDAVGTAAAQWFKYPTAAGETYMAGENAEDSARVVSTSISVTVPHGTYLCHQYQIIHYGLNYRRAENYYVAPGVGYIKYEEYYKPTGYSQFLQSVWELDDLTL